MDPTSSTRLDAGLAYLGDWREIDRQLRRRTRRCAEPDAGEGAQVLDREARAAAVRAVPASPEERVV